MVLSNECSVVTKATPPHVGPSPLSKWRATLNKILKTRLKAATSWKAVPWCFKIDVVWNPTVPNQLKALKSSRKKDSCKISELVGFQTVVILNSYSMAFHAVVVTGLFFDFLFKVNLCIFWPVSAPIQNFLLEYYIFVVF